MATSKNAGIDAYGVIEPQIYDVVSVAYSARRSDETAEAAWQDRHGLSQGEHSPGNGTA